MTRSKRFSGQTSIVIVNWNTRDLTARCVRSVAKEISSTALGEFEVIVVDNASSDGSIEMLRSEFPWVHLLCNEQNAGFARANNQGIEASQGEYVLLLNSDTEVHQGALGTLIAFMEGHAGAGAAGAMLLNADGSLQESCRPMLTPERELWRLLYLDRLWPRGSYRMATWDAEDPRPVEVMMGACMMLRQQALADVGVLDDRYFMYTEEVDLCYRLAEAEWGLWYVPAAKVTHFGQASSRQVAQEMFVELYRSKVQFYRKFGGESLASRFKRLLRVAYVPRLALAKIVAVFSPGSAQRVARYSHMLHELDQM